MHLKASAQNYSVSYFFLFVEALKFTKEKKEDLVKKHQHRG